MIRSALIVMRALASTLHAQEDPQSQAELIQEVDETWNLRWWGVSGRTYFLQASDDLQTWHFAPIIEGGNDELIEYETGALGDRFFIRMVYTDQTAPDLDAADFDGDNLSNLAEITTHHTHPLRSDSDNDTMPDDWEIEHGLDPNDDGSIDPVNGASGDLDGDGIPNGAEQIGGTKPDSNQDFPPQVQYVIRQGTLDFDSPTGELHEWASWVGGTQTTVLSAPMSTGDMATSLSQKFAFPPSPPPQGTASGENTLLVVGTYQNPGASRYGYVQEARVWLKASPADIAKGKGSRKYLKETRRESGPLAGPFTYEVTGVSVETLSDTPLDIQPTVDFPPSTPSYYSSTMVGWCRLILFRMRG